MKLLHEGRDSRLTLHPTKWAVEHVPGLPNIFRQTRGARRHLVRSAERDFCPSIGFCGVYTHVPETFFQCQLCCGPPFLTHEVVYDDLRLHLPAISITKQAGADFAVLDHVEPCLWHRCHLAATTEDQTSRRRWRFARRPWHRQRDSQVGPEPSGLDGQHRISRHAVGIDIRAVKATTFCNKLVSSNNNLASDVIQEDKRHRKLVEDKKGH